MIFTFARTGGLVAVPGMEVRASVTLEPSGGGVSSDDGYRRALDVSESDRVRQDVEAVAAALLEAPPRPGSSSPDAFRLLFLIDGGSRQLEVTSGAVVRGAQEALAGLSEWASREADSIVRRRFRDADPMG